jgi:hypothetical protein
MDDFEKNSRDIIMYYYVVIFYGGCFMSDLGMILKESLQVSCT